MKTFPNQKVIKINKPNYTENYLSVGIDEWTEASNNLTYNAFKLYLYLASNANGFDLALSPKALKQKVKMSDNTYTNVVKELGEKGYLVQKQGNIYDFYTVPHSTLPQCNGIPHSNGVVYPNTMGEYTPIEWGSIPQYNGGEITNTTNINTITKESERDFTNVKEERAKAPESEEELEDTLEEELDRFDDGTLIKIRQRLEKGKTDRVKHGYNVIKKDYDIQNKLSWDAVGIIDGIIHRREHKKRQDEAANNIDVYVPKTAPREFVKKEKKVNEKLLKNVAW